MPNVAQSQQKWKLFDFVLNAEFFNQSTCVCQVHRMAEIVRFHCELLLVVCTQDKIHLDARSAKIHVLASLIVVSTFPKEPEPKISPH